MLCLSISTAGLDSGILCIWRQLWKEYGNRNCLGSKTPVWISDQFKTSSDLLSFEEYLNMWKSYHLPSPNHIVYDQIMRVFAFAWLGLLLKETTPHHKNEWFQVIKDYCGQ